MRKELGGLWKLQALCRTEDSDMFFSQDRTGTEKAIEFCQDCTVRPDCLDFALTYRITDGVWGGTSEEDRKRMLRKRPVRTAPIQSPTE